MIPVTLEKFIGTIMYAPVEGHILHVKSRKYSEHMALDEFYQKAPEMVDKIVEQTFACLPMPLQKYENVLSWSNYEDSVGYLNALRAFVVQSKPVCYSPDKHADIISSIDDFIGLIDSVVYKLVQLTEGLDDATFNQTEAERQFIAGRLEYNGINVKRFFDDKAGEISQAIEAALQKNYRCVSRNYMAIYYSKVTKNFITVFESYSKGHYACAAMPMIKMYTPEIITGAKLFKAADIHEIDSVVKGFSKSYQPIYIRR